MRGQFRDIRTNPMKRTDGDSDGNVLQILTTGRIDVYPWDSVGQVVAWMPLSELPEFVPEPVVPSPPEGWRLVVDGDTFDVRRKRWAEHKKQWIAGTLDFYTSGDIYIVPIDPPEPTYRAFKGAAEFQLFKNMWWRDKTNIPSHQNPPAPFNDHLRFKETWRASFDTKVFCDGTPFGVKQ